MRWFKRKKTIKSAEAFSTEKIFLWASMQKQNVYTSLNTRRYGLYDAQVAEKQSKYGANEVSKEKKDIPLVSFAKTFINPFIGILMALAIVSMIIDVLIAEPEDQDWTTVIIITIMVLLSAILRFTQELKSNKASEALQKMVKNTISVYRNNNKESQEINITELVPGDIVYLAAGDMIPADIRILSSKDLFVSQASLTGESDSVEKNSMLGENIHRTGSIVELEDICFMGSNVVSGSAVGVVFATGQSTYLGTIAKSINGGRAQTSFDKGINKVSLLLIRFMIVMVPFVFLINGITKGDWLDAFIFAVSVAVGLTPEMLPMIVTSNLAKGAVTMSKRKTIVKDLNSIQNLGAMNILCTDKTGTLTNDKIVLERYLNTSGQEDIRVLRHAYLNSFFQTGLKNLMDKAILSHTKDLEYEDLEDHYRKIDEIPFDFTRRRMSVVIKDAQGKSQIVTKGAVEEMLDICGYLDLEGEVIELDTSKRELITKQTQGLNNNGLRVLAVAHKSWIDKDSNFGVEDESEMVLIGLLAFLDPPKASAASAIRQLHEYGVEVKVLSGDNEAVVKTVCRQVGIDTKYALLGHEIENMTDEELLEQIPHTKVYAKLTPMQKTRIIVLLQQAGNTVGFLGDGINDAPALRQSDVGISVDTAVDIAKESADIILLEKDLMVLEDGVIEGRKIFGNIMKYIKMTASSNFGNVFSVMIASAFLPFLPMMPIQLLIQNLLYDISQTAIPFDRVDKEYIQHPKVWDASDLRRFMMYIGPISSIFDVLTYIILWFVMKYNLPEYAEFFQTGWFIEGLLSQTLIVHMIRTRKIPFIQSVASWPLIIMTSVVIILGIMLPYTFIGTKIGLVTMPLSYYPWLVGILLCYCFCTQFVKQWYIKKFNKWL